MVEENLTDVYDDMDYGDERLMSLDTSNSELDKQCSMLEYGLEFQQDAKFYKEYEMVKNAIINSTDYIFPNINSDFGLTEEGFDIIRSYCMANKINLELLLNKIHNYSAINLDTIKNHIYSFDNTLDTNVSKYQLFCYDVDLTLGSVGAYKPLFKNLFKMPMYLFPTKESLNFSYIKEISKSMENYYEILNNVKNEYNNYKKTTQYLAGGYKGSKGRTLTAVYDHKLFKVLGFINNKLNIVNNNLLTLTPDQLLNLEYIKNKINSKELHVLESLNICLDNLSFEIFIQESCRKYCLV